METAAPLWKSVGAMEPSSQFGGEERSLGPTLGWRGAHWEVFLGFAGPVDRAGWKDDGCVPLLGKAMCWHGVGGPDMDTSLTLMNVPSGRLQAMGGEAGFLWPARTPFPCPEEISPRTLAHGWGRCRARAAGGPCLQGPAVA